MSREASDLIKEAERLFDEGTARSGAQAHAVLVEAIRATINMAWDDKQETEEENCSRQKNLFLREKALCQKMGVNDFQEMVDRRLF